MLSRIIKYSQPFAIAKTFASAPDYIQRFEELQKNLRKQQKLIQSLNFQVELAQRVNTMTFMDILRLKMSKITKAKFQSQAMKDLHHELLSHRNQLQNIIQQSNRKWQQPRIRIRKVRQQILEDFLGKFVNLDLLLQNIIAHKISAKDLEQSCILTHRMLLSILEKHGVQFFDAQVGTPYNPDLHETLDSGEVGRNIKEIYLKSRGWKIGKKVVKKVHVRLE